MYYTYILVLNISQVILIIMSSRWLNYILHILLFIENKWNNAYKNTGYVSKSYV